MAASDSDRMEAVAMVSRDDEAQLAVASVAAGLCNNPKDADDQQLDPFLVAFHPGFDATNPLDWRAGKKWMVTDVLSATGFNRIMVSTIMAPALPTIAREFGMNPTEAAMSMSIYLLATAFGPLVIGPLSEMYGRQVVLHGSNVWFLVWNILCGFAESKETLIAARFLAGFGASAIYSLGAGVMGDVWRPEQRGRSLGIYLLIPLLGAAVGPIIGGFIAMRSDWRWMFWSTSAFQGAMILASFFCFPETYGPLILRRRARKLRKDTGNPRYYTLGERLDGTRSSLALIWRAVSRPTRLLLTNPIIQVVSVETALNYGILYIVLSTFSELWMTQYGQTVEISALHYLVVSAAEVAGAQLGGFILDFMYKRRQSRGVHVPESRLLPAIPFFVVGCAGMILYGWVAQCKLHWAVVDVGVFIMLFGQQVSGTPTSAYLIDSYGDHVSSAMGAMQFPRSLTAFLFPLFAPSMYRVLGYGWSNTILSVGYMFISVPLTIYLWKYGAGLRQRAVMGRYNETDKNAGGDRTAKTAWVVESNGVK
ncbi:hypothetical protein PWT90_03368 [Aphanocladium album]|nr:hypothetical protein PWT90_03368 [Aphanocladium album]